MRALALLALCAVFVVLAGCGNKGPLYMPAKPAPAPAAAPAATPAHAASTAAPAQH